MFPNMQTNAIKRCLVTRDSVDIIVPAMFIPAEIPQTRGPTLARLEVLPILESSWHRLED